MKLIYPVFLSSNIVADNIMQTHQWQVLGESHRATDLPLGSPKTSKTLS